MEQPLVSVTIASYNHENYVQECLRSVINQTYPNIELIIINDGSKDSTWEKILEMKDECEKRFTRVIMETQENQGINRTNEKLASFIQGKYRYIIASDDLMKPEAIEKEVNFLEANPEYGLCVGNDEIIDKNSVRCYWDKNQNIVYDEKKAKYKTVVEFLKHKKNNFTDKKFGTYKTLFADSYIPNGYMIRVSILNKIVKLNVSDLVEDWFMMMQISKYSKMKYIDEILFSYRWHDTNTIKNKSLMKGYGDNTRKYEAQILENINESEVYPEVLEVKKNGILARREGVPFIFEVLTYKKCFEKVVKFKLFGIKIFEKVKKYG